MQAAHLRPLERSELKKKAEVSWNHCYREKEDTVLKEYNKFGAFSSELKLNSDHKVDGIGEPKTTAEFFRIWMNLPSPEEKFDYLYRIR